MYFSTIDPHPPKKRGGGIRALAPRSPHRCSYTRRGAGGGCGTVPYGVAPHRLVPPLRPPRKSPRLPPKMLPKMQMVVPPMRGLGQGGESMLDRLQAARWSHPIRVVGTRRGGTFSPRFTMAVALLDWPEATYFFLNNCWVGVSIGGGPALVDWLTPAFWNPPDSCLAREFRTRCVVGSGWGAQKSHRHFSPKTPHGCICSSRGP